MARPKAVINEDLARAAATELSKIGDHKICLRLQAIISSAAYPITTVAKVLGFSRVEVWRWIKRFAKEGVAGLYDRYAGVSPFGEECFKLFLPWANTR